MNVTGTDIAQLAVISSVVPLALFGVRFHRRQNSGALGGGMSRAKAYWLCFAIWLWFVLAPAAGFASGALDTAGPARALAVFGVFMWLRGAAEMVMLYVTKNWRPPMGISHDAACILVVAGFAAAGVDDGELPPESAPVAALCALMIVSLIVEIHHAWSFHHAVRGRTTGEAGVWFADEEQERFRKINRNTRVWNVILTVGAVAFVAHWVLS